MNVNVDNEKTLQTLEQRSNITGQYFRKRLGQVKEGGLWHMLDNIGHKGRCDTSVTKFVQASFLTLCVYTSSLYAGL